VIFQTQCLVQLQSTNGYEITFCRKCSSQYSDVSLFTLLLLLRLFLYSLNYFLRDPFLCTIWPLVTRVLFNLLLFVRCALVKLLLFVRCALVNLLLFIRCALVIFLLFMLCPLVPSLLLVKIIFRDTLRLLWDVLQSPRDILPAHLVAYCKMFSNQLVNKCDEMFCGYLLASCESSLFIFWLFVKYILISFMTFSNTFFLVNLPPTCEMCLHTL
jgi:hypothetical protein